MSDTHGAGPPEGWYPDPRGSGHQRYWNGQRWTTRVQVDAWGSESSGAEAQESSSGVQATPSQVGRRIPKWVWTSAVSALIAATIAIGTMWWLNRGTSPTASPNPATAQQAASQMPPPPSSSPTAQAAPPAAPAACGPDQAAALSAALSHYPADPETGWLWDHTPLYSNYDPCADLSAIVVTVEGATGSSPEQALMFHRGTFLGTGTSKSYAFTTLDSSASTKDTVVLTYRSGQSCTACGDGIVTSVRYHWDGNKVQMLDPPPPG